MNARIMNGLARAERLGMTSGARLTGDAKHDLAVLQAIVDRDPTDDLEAVTLYVGELLRRRFAGRWCALRGDSE